MSRASSARTRRLKPCTTRSSGWWSVSQRSKPARRPRRRPIRRRTNRSHHRHRRMSRRSMRRRCSPSNRRRCLRRAHWSPLHRASPRPPCRHARLRSCMCSAPSARRSIRTFRPIRRSNPAAPGVRAHLPSALPPRKPHSPRSSASRPRKSPARRISLPPRGAPHRPRRVKAARSKVRAAKNARARRHRRA